MHNVLEDIKDETNTIDLDTEYKKALKNSNFKAITKNLKIDEDILKKYTSIINECSIEYDHCKNCKNLLDCQNKVEGYCYLPVNANGSLTFSYIPCKYTKAHMKNSKYLDNISFFNTPEYVSSTQSPTPK